MKNEINIFNPPCNIFYSVDKSITRHCSPTVCTNNREKREIRYEETGKCKCVIYLMSIYLRNLPSQTAHDKVFDNNPDRIGIWKCWFLRRGVNRSTRRKTSRSKDENQQQTQPTYDAESGNRTRATLVGGLRGR